MTEFNITPEEPTGPLFSEPIVAMHNNEPVQVIGFIDRGLVVVRNDDGDEYTVDENDLVLARERGVQ